MYENFNSNEKSGDVFDRPPSRRKDDDEQEENQTKERSWKSNLKNTTKTTKESFQGMDSQNPRNWVYMDAICDYLENINGKEGFNLNEGKENAWGNIIAQYEPSIKGVDDLEKYFLKEPEWVEIADIAERYENGINNLNDLALNLSEKLMTDISHASTPWWCAIDENGMKIRDGEKPKLPKRDIMDKQFPTDCHPDNVIITFAPKKLDWHHLGMAWLDTETDNKNSNIRVSIRKPTDPGWLVDLTYKQLKTIHYLKWYLSNMHERPNMEKYVDKIHHLLEQIGLDTITKGQILRIFQWVPSGKDSGLDYCVFFLALGDFGYAKRQGLLRKSPRKLLYKNDLLDSLTLPTDESDTNGESDDDPLDPEWDKELNNFEYYFPIKKLEKVREEEEPPPFPIRQPEEYVPTRERRSMYMWRLKIIKAREKQKNEEIEWAVEQVKERKNILRKIRRVWKAKEEWKKREEERQKEKKDSMKKNDKAALLQLAEGYFKKGYGPLTSWKKAKHELRRIDNEILKRETEDDTGKYKDKTKVLWTGLFLTEMFVTMEMVKRMAIDSTAVIPRRRPPREPRERQAYEVAKAKKDAERGPPFLRPIPFVNCRLEAKSITNCDTIAPDTRSKVAFDHWILDFPQNGVGTVIMAENKHRIQEILHYVFYKKGNIFCKLPHVHLMLHFVHNLADQILGQDQHNLPLPDPMEYRALVDEHSQGELSEQSAEETTLEVNGEEKNKLEAKETPDNVDSNAEKLKSSSCEKLDNENSGPQVPKSSLDSKNLDAKENDAISVNSHENGSKNGDENKEDQSKSSDKPSGGSGCIGGKRVPEPFKNPYKFHQSSNKPKKINPCKRTPKTPSRTLPNFDSTESQWISRYSERLPKPAYALEELKLPKEKIRFSKLPYYRKKVGAHHHQQWTEYNCRRMELRKDLWANMKINQNYPLQEGRDKISKTFWSLLPPINSQPRGLVNTKIDRSLN